MYTLGYRFRPWTDAEGDRRRAVDPALHPRDRRRGRHRRQDPLRPRRAARRLVERRRRWTVHGERAADGARGDAARALPLRVQRLLRLRRRLPARVRGRGDFAGRIVHPQLWPEDLDYAGKRVVVIGSGATAVTLVPALAETRGARDDAAALADLRRLAAGARPDRATRCSASCPSASRTRSTRWKNVLLGTLLLPARAAPARRRSSERIVAMAAAAARRRTATRDTHFTPRYKPVGPARLPGPRRRPVRGHPRRPRLGRHRHDRSLHARRHPSRFGRDARRPTSSSSPPGSS